jgi:hypothetical protein
MFAFISRLVRGDAPRHGGGQVAAEVRAPVKATMAGVVRRFQGVYECGCTAHPLNEPHECPEHGVGRLYIEEAEKIEFNNVRVQAVT